MAEPTDIIDTDPFDPAVLEEYENALAKEIGEAPNDAKAMLERRRRAYVEVYSAGVTSQESLDIVLADLAWFCKMYVDTYDIRDGIHAEELSKRKQGRREAFQRILHFSRLNLDALLLMYTDAITK